MIFVKSVAQILKLFLYKAARSDAPACNDGANTYTTQMLLFPFRIAQKTLRITSVLFPKAFQVTKEGSTEINILLDRSEVSWCNLTFVVFLVFFPTVECLHFALVLMYTENKMFAPQENSPAVSALNPRKPCTGNEVSQELRILT